MRYGFQNVRLCYALEDYEKGIQFVENDYLFAPTDGRNVLSYSWLQAACHVKSKEIF